MLNQSLKPQIDVWINEDLILKDTRLHPILMHLSQPDTDPENFWNLLRNELNTSVKVLKFNHLIEAGSIVVIPHPLEDYISAGKHREILKFKGDVLKSGRTLLTTTVLEYFPKQGEIVLLLSAYRSRKHDGIIVTPAWLYDLRSRISSISKPSKPTIGFVGAVGYPGRLNAFFGSLPISNSLLNKVVCSSHINCNLSLGARQIFAKKIREEALRKAAEAPELKTSFIWRKDPHFGRSDKERELARTEYVKNMQDNAYILCIRGTENYSYRLYEVMSAGRIPVIIDTNMQLPDLSGFGKWDEFSVIVPSSKIHCIGKIVQEFHNRFSDEEFEGVCCKSRAAFEYLLPHQFMLRTLWQNLLKP